MLSVGVGFWGYELGQSIFRDLNDGQSPNPRQRGFIGGISALAIMTATMPLETILRRLQVNHTALVRIETGSSYRIDFCLQNLTNRASFLEIVEGPT